MDVRLPLRLVATLIVFAAALGGGLLLTLLVSGAFDGDRPPVEPIVVTTEPATRP